MITFLPHTKQLHLNKLQIDFVKELLRDFIIQADKSQNDSNFAISVLKTIAKQTQE
jgi:hypothetical protein